LAINDCIASVCDVSVATVLVIEREREREEINGIYSCSDTGRIGSLVEPALQLS
jgi:hypothetical protein